MEATARLSAQSAKEGKIVAGGGLAPMATSSRVRLSGGKLAVLDGPFTETKEVVGGYAVMEFNSREAAVQSAVEFMELTKKYWPGWEGETEVRQIQSLPPALSQYYPEEQHLIPGLRKPRGSTTSLLR